MNDNYIVDSSIWIEVERQNALVRERLKSLVDEGRVVLVDVILAEVLRGTKTEKII